MVNIESWFSNQKETMKRRAETFGSPSFQVKPTSTTAGAKYSFGVRGKFPASIPYEPLNWVQTINNDVVNITIIINGTEEYPVQAGQVVAVKHPAIRMVEIRNDDAVTATTLNAIILTLMRVPRTADDVARGL